MSLELILQTIVQLAGPTASVIGSLGHLAEVKHQQGALKHDSDTKRICFATYCNTLERGSERDHVLRMTSLEVAKAVAAGDRPELAIEIIRASVDTLDMDRQRLERLQTALAGTLSSGPQSTPHDLPGRRRIASSR